MSDTRWGYGLGSALLLAAALIGCGDDDGKKQPVDDSGVSDAGSQDAGGRDASTLDAATPQDAATADTGSSDSGRGEDAAPADASAADAAPLPSIVLNEVGPSDAGYGWLELYNPTDASISLSHVTPSISHGGAVSGTISGQNESLPAGAYKVVYAGDSPRDLIDPGAAGIYFEGRTVDSYVWTMPTNTSYGRCPNATGAFVKTTTATPGAANACP